MTKHALVLGATGSYGGAVALELLRRGWRVRVLRDIARLNDYGTAGAIEPVIAMRSIEDVTRAAEGCSVIVHGVNHP
jgi:uncharacterized protein YbjT (DUF2867 family)